MKNNDPKKKRGFFGWIKDHIVVGRDKKRFGSKDSPDIRDGAYIGFKIKF